MTSPSESQTRPAGGQLSGKLLYLVTEDWQFCLHFLVMARAARQSGLDVAVATRIRNHEAQITAEGFRAIPLEIDRGSLGSLPAAVAVRNIAKIIQSERPDIVHCIGLPMAVLGGLASRIMGVNKIVLAPTGLGHLWIFQDFSVRTLRMLVRLFVGRLLRSRSVYYLFENSEDVAEFGIQPQDSHLTIIGGVGVEAKYPLSPEPPSPPVRVAVVSRMLRTKGIVESVEATQAAIAKGADVELHLFGIPDPSNPSSLTTAELLAFANLKNVYWHGFTEQIANVWDEHHIGMLMSYREGLPRSLVEAAACGRPIITSDVVGCREVVHDGVQGFLVPPHDIAQIAERLAQLAADKDLRVRMGHAAHSRFSLEFTAEKVAQTITSFYRRLFESGRQLSDQRAR